MDDEPHAEPVPPGYGEENVLRKKHWGQVFILGVSRIWKYLRKSAW